MWDHLSDTGRYLSEDYGFCRLWEGMGQKIYIDAKSNLSHQGSKLYQGNYAQSLLNNFAFAIPAEAGMPMEIHGLDYLKD